MDGGALNLRFGYGRRSFNSTLPGEGEWCAMQPTAAGKPVPAAAQQHRLVYARRKINPDIRLRLVRARQLPEPQFPELREAFRAYTCTR